MNRRFPRPARRIKVIQPDPSTTENTTQPARNKPTRSKFGLLRPWVFATFLVVAFSLGLGSGYLAWGSGTRAAADQGASPTQSFTRYKVAEAGNPGIGPAKAPITIIEFGDYQCPYCQRWETQVYKQLLDAYPTQVRLVYRDLPLMSIHPQAEPAAEAADCAGEQNAYFQYHDKLFSYEYDLGREAFLSYARELKLDMTSFTQCLDSHKYKDEVMTDYQDAMNLGLSGTPTFYINGIMLVGAQSLETFKNIIDKELAGDLPK